MTSPPAPPPQLDPRPQPGPLVRVRLTQVPAHAGILTPTGGRRKHSAERIPDRIPLRDITLRTERPPRDYDQADDHQPCTCGHQRGQHDPFTAACWKCDCHPYRTDQK